ncbi:MAG: hypothetical protein KJ053_02145 [Dehalococcoidia bacterium]|nr:hypothetical protein [Dehalococcoidia bacterium]
MTDETRLCPDCGAGYAGEDNYCRQCGMYVAALRTLPVPASQPQARAVEPVRAALPAPVKKAAAAIAVGTALQVGLGLAGKYMARQAAKQAVSAVKPKGRAVPAKAAAKPGRAVAEPARAVTEPASASAVSETLIIRRVWVRRD